MFFKNQQKNSYLFAFLLADLSWARVALLFGGSLFVASLGLILSLFLLISGLVVSRQIDKWLLLFFAKVVPLLTHLGNDLLVGQVGVGFLEFFLLFLHEEQEGCEGTLGCVGVLDLLYFLGLLFFG